MASLFDEVSGDIRLLDAGAGVGSLTAGFVERICSETNKPRSLSLTCYEIEPVLIGYLKNTLDEAVAQCAFSQIKCTSNICDTDFILDNQSGQQPSMFEAKKRVEFTHAIMNPPYKKINSASEHRAALRQAGIETSNLYTGFMFLAAQRLQQGGEMVAIVPRSFCNGPYFKPFREQFFSMMALRHIRIFEKRNSAFKGDDVLQENIILHAVKGGERQAVKITTSRGGEFELHEDGGDCIAHDMTQRIVHYQSVIRPSDPDKFLHIASNEMEQGIIDRMATFTTTLADIGLEVSTGPVVDFRLKPDLRAQPEKGAVPLLYAQHFQHGVFQWLKDMKKPNAIHVSDGSRRWLWPNDGHYVVTRRFTSKEERRRLVLVMPNTPGSGITTDTVIALTHKPIPNSGHPPPLFPGNSSFSSSSLSRRVIQGPSSGYGCTWRSYVNTVVSDRTILRTVSRLRFSTRQISLMPFFSTK